MLTALLSLGLAPAMASGVLATHTNAFIDSSNFQWRGTTPFDDDGSLPLEGDGLEGTVDWAVFTDTDFTTAFPGSGYTPPAGEMVYTFQIEVAGIADVSHLSVGIDSEPTGTSGVFSGAGVTGTAPIADSLSLTSADYSFVGNTIPVGGASAGLVFSSIRIPKDFFGSLIDGGSSALVIPLPSPSSVSIPEPATLVLAGMAVLLLGLMRRRDR
ncbi:MAG: PEP-CTERM sorting domain-containing protein [Thermoanaerobaculales bacterium]